MTIQSNIFNKVSRENLHIARLNELAYSYKKAKKRNDLALAKIYLEHFKFLLKSSK